MIIPFLVLLICVGHSNGFSLRGEPLEKLLVVSFDAFRYDYLNKTLTPNLFGLLQNASHARFVINVFPTQTFPNHFTISTGLYTEVHGVLASHVWENKTGKELEYGYDLWHYNDNIQPIWILNEQTGDGRHSGVMMWPGSDFSYNGTNVTFNHLFNESMPFKERVDIVMTWFKDSKTPANLVMLYFEEPDGQSHIYGPGSEQVTKQIERVDKISKYITDSLKKNGLTDVNVIFLSDHGMDGVKKEDIINLTSVVGNAANMYGTSPVLQVYPNGSSENDVYKKLKDHANEVKTYNVYMKADIPDEFHYKNCERAPPILVVAQPGHAFQDLYNKIEYYEKYFNVSGNGLFGVHGYDPNSEKMHPFFMAYGPLFKSNYTIDKSVTVNNIDFYPFFQHVLQLKEPYIKPNGSKKSLDTIFVNSSPHEKSLHISLMAVFLGFCILIPIIITVVATLEFFDNKKRNKDGDSCSVRYYDMKLDHSSSTSERLELLKCNDEVVIT